MSYATDQGSVGPHFDHYDVFLLQAEGERLWKVGDFCNEDPINKTPLVKNCDLSLVQQFTTQQEWLLKPGDILYLPPKLAHWGIAQGECMTFSIGFRAPKKSEMISAYCDERLQQLMIDDFYRDSEDLIQQLSTPSNISSTALEDIKAMLLDELTNTNAIAQWFGQHITTPRYSHFFNEEDIENQKSSNNYLINDCPTDTVFYKKNGSRFAYTSIVKNNNKEDKDLSYLFVNGKTFTVSTELAALVSNQTSLTKGDVSLYQDKEDQLLLEYLLSNELIEAKRY